METGGRDANKNDFVAKDCWIDRRFLPGRGFLFRKQHIERGLGVVERRGAVHPARIRPAVIEEHARAVAGNVDVVLAGGQERGCEAKRRHRHPIAEFEKRLEAANGAAIAFMLKERVVPDRGSPIRKHARRQAQRWAIARAGALPGFSGKRRGDQRGGVGARLQPVVRRITEHHDVAGPPDRCCERRVRGAPAHGCSADRERAAGIRLEKQHVVRDHARVRANEIVDDARVHDTRPRPSAKRRLDRVQ